MEPVFGVRRDPPPDLDAVGEDEALAARIRAEIVRDGPIPFARFMDLALYDPDGGYYRATEARPGRAGDFLTAPEIHPIFGWALAGLLEDVWRRTRRASSVRPPGARRRDGDAGPRHPRPARADGIAAARRPRLRPGRRGARPARRPSPRGLADRGAADRPARRGPPRRPVTGVVLANEVLDALPVHRVRRRGDRLVEIAVGARGRRLRRRRGRAVQPGPRRPARRRGDRARRRPDRRDLPRGRALGGRDRRRPRSAACCC